MQSNTICQFEERVPRGLQHPLLLCILSIQVRERPAHSCVHSLSNDRSAYSCRQVTRLNELGSPVGHGFHVPRSERTPTFGPTDAEHALHTLSYKYISYGVDESFRRAFMSCSVPSAVATLQTSNSDACSSSVANRAWMSGDA